MKAGFLDVYTKLLKQFEWPLVRLFSVNLLIEANFRLFYCNVEKDCVMWLYSLSVSLNTVLITLYLFYMLMIFIVFTIELTRYVEKELLK